MKKILVSLVSVLLILGIVSVAIAATFQESAVTASASVNQFVSITLTDAGVAGVNFGSLDPGTSDTPDAAQTSVIPAIKVTNDVVSNVNIKVNAKGTDFSDGGVNSFGAGQATYDDDNIPSQGVETGKAETALANAYPGVDYYTGIAPGSNAGFWFFLDIPSSQAAASYTSTLTFKGAA